MDFVSLLYLFLLLLFYCISSVSDKFICLFVSRKLFFFLYLQTPATSQFPAYKQERISKFYKFIKPYNVFKNI